MIARSKNLPAVTYAQVIWAQIALAVLIILWLIFIPFLVFDPLSFLFWGWFRAMVIYSLYAVMAGAVLRVFSAVGIAYITSLGNANLDMQSLMDVGLWMLAVMPLFVSGMLASLKCGELASMLVTSGGAGELVPIGEVFGGLDGPVKAIHEVSPQASHHFTQADQVNQLVSASEADPDLGFMARLMALCSLPRTNPGDRIRYKRVNGPYTLYMTAGGGGKLPYGNLPRLLLAWLSTEAVRTQSRELVLGKSLSDFMRTLINHPVPIDMNTLTALKRYSLGIDLYLWLSYRIFSLRVPLQLSWRQLYLQFGTDPAKASDKRIIKIFRRQALRELKKIKTAWADLNYATAPGVLILLPSTPVISPVSDHPELVI